MGVYEDNFGFWDIDGPEERALFEHVQRQSVYINCKRCERFVRLIPPQPFAPLASAPSNAAHHLR
jgi:hypothetical protein